MKKRKVTKDYYRGIEINCSLSPEFGTPYYSIINIHITYKDKNGKRGNPYCHTYSRKSAERIIDCFHCIKKYSYCSKKYTRITKDKALRLLNYNIRFNT